MCTRFQKMDPEMNILSSFTHPTVIPNLHDFLSFYIFYSFSWRFYPKWLTIAIYVRGRMPLEQLGVKCLAQGQIGVEPRSLTSKACVVSVPSPPIYGCHTIWLRWRLFTLLRWINHLSSSVSSERSKKTLNIQKKMLPIKWLFHNSRFRPSIKTDLLSSFSWITCFVPEWNYRSGWKTFVWQIVWYVCGAISERMTNKEKCLYDTLCERGNPALIMKIPPP